MAITNNIPQFDKSKTNLGEAPVDGFKANTLAKSEEVNKAIYDCSLSITALIKALNNTYGGFLASNRQIDSSQSVDDIANTLSLILGLNVENPRINGNSHGDLWIDADGLKYNSAPLLLKKINGYPFDSFLIQDKNFVCTTLSNFNEYFITTHIPITAFYLVENSVNIKVKNIDNKEISFRPIKGDIYPMYMALQKYDDQYWFNMQFDTYANPSGPVNTISLREDGDGIIPCPLTGDPLPGKIYVVGISTSIMD